MFRICRALAFSLVILAPVKAHSLELEDLNFSVFVDTYYAYDFNRPPTLDRQFTTQPARHNEFNINLVYLEGKIDRERVHGRVAFQAGTSVQGNYAGEPSIGSISGPSLSRNIQEAYTGYRIGAKTWIDAGIMFSHLGLESFLSRDNLTYTRSLVADFSPYYQTGLRLTSALTEKLSGQLLILNGWQNISESNAHKAIGTQLSYAFSPNFSLTYNTFFGQESAFRHFHDLYFKYSPTDSWWLALQLDAGFQTGLTGGKASNWRGFTAIAKYSLSQKLALVSRIERYEDPQNILIASSNGYAFKSWGASLGADCALDSNLWWRNEARRLFADHPVFTAHNGPTRSDTLVVSSLSVTF